MATSAASHANFFLYSFFYPSSSFLVYYCLNFGIFILIRHLFTHSLFFFLNENLSQIIVVFFDK